jgi:hypothetical protein
LCGARRLDLCLHFLRRHRRQIQGIELRHRLAEPPACGCACLVIADLEKVHEVLDLGAALRGQGF